MERSHRTWRHIAPAKLQCKSAAVALLGASRVHLNAALGLACCPERLAATTAFWFQDQGGRCRHQAAAAASNAPIHTRNKQDIHSRRTYRFRDDCRNFEGCASEKSYKNIDTPT
jgi:hypothetical protein